MEGGREQQQQQRASVPAFGGWDDMAVAAGGAGALPDYSLDFSKIRAASMQRRKALSWSSGAAVAAGAGEEQQRSTAVGGGSEDRERRRGHRRQHSDATEDRQPIRAPPKREGRSKFKGYLFGCVGRW